MSVTVRIPTQLRPLTAGEGEIVLEAATVRDVISGLNEKHPGIGERLLDESGELRRFVNVFVADEDVRFLEGLNTPLTSGQSVSIVPAVAGG
jgi:molybdopterin synthase sulfur carrier subunit